MLTIYAIESRTSVTEIEQLLWSTRKGYAINVPFINYNLQMEMNIYRFVFLYYVLFKRRVTSVLSIPHWRTYNVSIFKTNTWLH